jgi:hypothetical protein
LAQTDVGLLVKVLFITFLLFRCVMSYFRKHDGMNIQNHLSTATSRDLLLALESARSRLAVAMAAEYKSTPPDRWRYYLATADHMGRLARQLRRTGIEISREGGDATCVDALKKVAVSNNPGHICRVFGEIVSALE